MYKSFHKIHSTIQFKFRRKTNNDFSTISAGVPNVNFPFLPEWNIHVESNQRIEQRTKGKISSNKEAGWVYREYIKAVCFLHFFSLFFFSFFCRKSLTIFPASQKFKGNSIARKYAKINRSRGLMKFFFKLVSTYTGCNKRICTTKLKFLEARTKKWRISNI